MRKKYFYICEDMSSAESRTLDELQRASVLDIQRATAGWQKVDKEVIMSGVALQLLYIRKVGGEFQMICFMNDLHPYFNITQFYILSEHTYFVWGIDGERIFEEVIKPQILKAIS